MRTALRWEPWTISGLSLCLVLPLSLIVKFYPRDPKWNVSPCFPLRFLVPFTESASSSFTGKFVINSSSRKNESHYSCINIKAAQCNSSSDCDWSQNTNCYCFSNASQHQEEICCEGAQPSFLTPSSTNSWNLKSDETCCTSLEDEIESCGTNQSYSASRRKCHPEECQVELHQPREAPIAHETCPSSEISDTSTCRSRSLKYDNISFKVNIYGQEEVDPSVDIVISAVITNASDEYLIRQILRFQWSFNITGNVNRTFLGRELRIPAGTLRGGKSYHAMLNISDTKGTKSTHVWKFRTKMAALKAIVIPHELSLGTKETLVIDGSNSWDPSRIEKPLQFEWKCKRNRSSHSCFGNKTSSLQERMKKSVLEIPPGVLSPDSYIFTLNISKDDRNDVATSKVRIFSGTSPTFCIHLSSNEMVFTASQDIILSAYVTSTKSINMTWINVREKGFSRISLDKKPFSEQQLHQTIRGPFKDRPFRLYIPSLNLSKQWQGLREGYYKFRLITRELQMQQRTYLHQQSAYADINIKILPLPPLGKLKVLPKAGEALKTSFLLNSSESQDNCRLKNCSYQFSYIFPYVSQPIMIATLYNSFPVVDRIFLPGREGQNNSVDVGVMVRMCANSSACSSARTAVIVEGLRAFPHGNVFQLKTQIITLFHKGEWRKAFATVISCLLTLRRSPSRSIFETIFGDMLQEMANYWNQSSPLMISAFRDDGFELLRTVSSVISYNDATNKNILSPVFWIKQNLFGRMLIYSRPKAKMQTFLSRRRLLSIDNNRKIVNHITTEPMTEEEVQTFLSVDVLQLQSINEPPDVYNLLYNISIYLIGLCKGTTMENYTHNIRSEGVVLETRKIFFDGIADEVVPIAAETGDRNYVTFGRELEEEYTIWTCDPPTHATCYGACVTSAEISKDILPPATRETLLSPLVLVELLNPITAEAIEVKRLSFPITISMPVTQKLTQDEVTRISCAILKAEKGFWDRSVCQMEKVVSGYITCECTALGYFGVVMKDSGSNCDVISKECNLQHLSSTVVTPDGEKKFAETIGNRSKVHLGEPMSESDLEGTTEARVVEAIPVKLTINADYDSVVKGRERDFATHLVKQLAQILNIPEHSIQNMTIRKGSILVLFNVTTTTTENPRLATIKESKEEAKRNSLSRLIILTALDGRKLFVGNIETQEESLYDSHLERGSGTTPSFVGFINTWTRHKDAGIRNDTSLETTHKSQNLALKNETMTSSLDSDYDVYKMAVESDDNGASTVTTMPFTTQGLVIRNYIAVTFSVYKNYDTVVRGREMQLRNVLRVQMADALKLSVCNIPKITFEEETYEIIAVIMPWNITVSNVAEVVKDVIETVYSSEFYLNDPEGRKLPVVVKNVRTVLETEDTFTDDGISTDSTLVIDDNDATMSSSQSDILTPESTIAIGLTDDATQMASSQTIALTPESTVSMIDDVTDAFSLTDVLTPESTASITSNIPEMTFPQNDDTTEALSTEPGILSTPQETDFVPPDDSTIAMSSPNTIIQETTASIPSTPLIKETIIVKREASTDNTVGATSSIGGAVPDVTEPVGNGATEATVSEATGAVITEPPIPDITVATQFSTLGLPSTSADDTSSISEPQGDESGISDGEATFPPISGGSSVDSNDISGVTEDTGQGDISDGEATFPPISGSSDDVSGVTEDSGQGDISDGEATFPSISGSSDDTSGVTEGQGDISDGEATFPPISGSADDSGSDTGVSLPSADEGVSDSGFSPGIDTGITTSPLMSEDITEVSAVPEPGSEPPPPPLVPGKLVAFTIDADFAKVVIPRREQFMALLKKEIARIMRIPTTAIQNLSVFPGSIIVTFEVIPISSETNILDTDSLNIAIRQLDNLIDNGEVTIKDLDGNDMTIIPKNPPSKSGLSGNSNQAAAANPAPTNTNNNNNNNNNNNSGGDNSFASWISSPFVIGIAVTILVIMIILVVLTVVIVRNMKRNKHITPVHGEISPNPTYSNIPHEDSLPQVTGRDSAESGKFSYDSGVWVGPGAPDANRFSNNVPAAAIYRPPTQMEIVRTARPSSVVRTRLRERWNIDPDRIVPEEITNHR